MIYFSSDIKQNLWRGVKIGEIKILFNLYPLNYYHVFTNMILTNLILFLILIMFHGRLLHIICPELLTVELYIKMCQHFLSIETYLVTEPLTVIWEPTFISVMDVPIRSTILVPLHLGGS